LGQARPNPETIALEAEGISVACTPAQGFTITSLRDGRSGADALWTWRRSATPCSRALGAAGTGSVETFIDVFTGGWFAMFPGVGFPAEDNPTSLLHGELVRLPWNVLEQTSTAVTARVETVRSPFEVTRTLEVADGALQMSERIRNIGGEPAPYAWGHHPCFSRETFAGGVLELDVEAAHVPGPPYDADATRLAIGELEWPAGSARDGIALDLSVVPQDADGRVDHVCLRPSRGRARITAPRANAALELTWDLALFPHLLLWQNFRGKGGWPFWGEADTFAVEFSTIPGRTMPEAADAGAVRILAPAATVETSVTAAWTSL
jgi:galactose mutarotase-like enzyme